VTLEERVAQLERENRRTRRGGLVGLAIVVAGALLCTTGQAPKNEVVARRFRLVDQQNRTRVDFNSSDSAPGMDLYDEGGNIQATLNISKNGPRLLFVDEHGEVRAGLSLGKDGPGLFLWDKDRSTAALAIYSLGPALCLTDKQGQTRAMVALAAQEPMVRLCDERGRAKWSAP